MFPSDLEPAQIARKLVATMEARSFSEDNGLRAPDTYRVFVNPVDFARLSPHRDYLQREWSELLRHVGDRVGIRFVGDAPSVEMVEDPSVVTGGIEIDVTNGAQADRRYHIEEPIFVLRLTKGMPVNAAFAIDGATRVGRSRESDIFLVDPSVSRNHALLDVREGNLVVRDAGSTNGTFVNGERVQLRALRPGDRVAFGKTEMLVERGEP